MATKAMQNPVAPEGFRLSGWQYMSDDGVGPFFCERKPDRYLNYWPVFERAPADGHTCERDGMAYGVCPHCERLAAEAPAWTPFWFETNSAFGLVDSPKAWTRMRKQWETAARLLHLGPNAIYDLRSFDRTVVREGDLPNFGQRSEHLGGKTTLGQFFDAEGMKRD